MKKKRSDKKLAASWREGGKTAIYEEPARHGFVVPFTVIAAIVVVLLYVGAHLIVRTEGFRDIIADRLEQHVGMPVAVERCEMTWDMDLVVSGVKSPAEGNRDQVGLELGKGRLSWSLAGLRRGWGGLVKSVELENCRLALQMTDGGEWKPEAFAQFAGWLVKWGGFRELNDRNHKGPGERPRAEGKTEAARGPKRTAAKSDGHFWENVSVSVRDSRIVWRGADGSQLAEAEDISLAATPVRTPARRMNHYQAKVGSARTAGGRHIRDLGFEILTAKGHQIVLGFEGDWVAGGSSAPVPPAAMTASPRAEEPSRRTGQGLQAALDAQLAVMRGQSGTVEPLEEQIEPVEEPPPRVIEGDKDELAAYIRKMLEEAMEE
ncbi:MAG: hypothetical protein JXB04_11310 [Kiritimatiellae bacterium]|nr:hypothetical protein [Kiritimatiellia bacterium]